MGSRDEAPSSTTLNPHRLQIVSKQLSAKELPAKTLEIIMASWKKSTQKNYSSILRQWLSFCFERNFDSSIPSLNTVLAFLTTLYERGIDYSQINKARSALSVLYPDIQIGKHSLISRFVQGVRNLRTPQPKYPILWDAKDLLLYLANWKVSSTSPLKDITLKLVTIMACISTQRIHTLSLIDVRHIKFYPSATYLYIFDDLKVARHRPHFVITLPSLSDKDQLQTIEILQLYLERTRTFRLDKHHKLFLSWRHPHKPVTTDTLARWIREVMQAAGINIKAFGAHSVRGASASFALDQHASIDSVLQAGDWSCLQTFNKHYNRVNKSLPTKELSMTISSSNIYRSPNNQ